MTVLEGIQRSTQFLTKKGVESPRLQAELLLAHLLKLPRMQLYLNFERELNASEADLFRELIIRRGQREPLQHILGCAWFCGLEFAVDKRALIPRPETELLVERGSSLLKHWNPPDGNRRVVLDFGTGSGCVAVALAYQHPAIQIYAIDISADAIALARQNAQRHGVEERIQFLRGDGLNALSAEVRFDLILGNPPYIASAEIATLEPEVRDFDPRPALDGGTDGLEYYRVLAAEAIAPLRPEGRLILEFGDGQAQSVAHLFEQQNWIVEAIDADYNKRPRILIARKK